MWTLSALSCVFTQPTLLCAPLEFSCTFFFGLYGPPYESDRIQSDLCMPQSLYGTPSRPTVRSSRGSTAKPVAGAVAAASSSVLRLFHVVGLVIATGSPAASTTK